MNDNIIAPGDVLLIALPSNAPKGHEQVGYRPSIVVGIPKGEVRYPVVIVVPLTTKGGPWAKKNPNLYQQIPKGAGGVPQESIALVDQLRAIDAKRVKAYLGRLEDKYYQPIRDSLLELFQ